MTKFNHKLALMFVGLSVLASPAAMAEGVAVDGLNYVLNTSKKTATLTYFNSSASKNYPDLAGEVNVPATFSYNGVEYTVTAIKYHAFNGCSKITRVVLPSPISSIVSGSSSSYTGYLFTGCTSLEEVVFDPSSTLASIPAYTFANAPALKTVTLPPTVKTINNYTFKDCAALTTVNGLDNVTSVGTYAFQNCTSLESFVWPAGAKTITNYAFSGCSSLRSVTGTANVTSIGTHVFQGCTSLESFAWPATNNTALRTVPEYMFDGCSSLRNVTGTGNITTINAYAFRDCAALNVFDFPKLTSVGSYAFYGCTSLGSVEFKNSTAVGSHSFENCTGLTTVTFNPSMGAISANAFKNTGITEITLPSDYTIGSGVFEDCKALKTVNVPATTKNTVYYFGAGGFKNCTALTAVNFLNTETSAGKYIGGMGVFEGCSSLTDFTVPGNIQTLYIAFFRGANALKNLTLSEGLENLYSTNENITVGTGTNFLKDSKIEELVLPSTITNLGKANSMNNNIFQNMPELRKVTLPSTLAALKSSYLFYNCPKLTEVVFPEGLVSIDGDYNFSKCGFTTLQFPDNLVHIKGQRNFAECLSLQEVVLGKSLSEIYASSETAGINTTNRSNIFYGCTALDRVVVPSGLKVLTGSYMFSGCPVRELVFQEPATIETIARNVFAEMTETTEITLPASLRNLYWRSISQNPKLETVTFTAPLADDGVYPETFIKNESLKNVNMADGSKAIGNRWFFSCSSLKDFTMPRDLETIGTAAFYRSGLENLTFNDKLVELGDSCLYQRVNVVPVFPKTLRRIGSHNFYDNMNVTSGVFDLPALEEIGDYAFRNCPMTSIDLDKTVIKNIGNYAFYHTAGTSLITDMQFPATLEFMGKASIGNSNVCKRIVFKSPTPPDVSDSNCAFNGPEQSIYRNAKMYVPPMSYDAYRSAAHITRFYFQNDTLRDNIVRITDLRISQTEISRWIPCADETLTTTLAHLGVPVNDYSVIWKSTDPSVVTVDENGTVSFTAPGTAFVTATYTDPVYGELTATCRVNVFDHLYDLTLDQPVEMYVGDTQPMTAHATMVPENVYVDGATYGWSTADNSKLTVDEAGVVTAREPGIVAVTATWTDPDGEVHAAQRNVVIKPEYSVDFGDENAIVMYVGDVTKFTNAVATFRGEPIANSKLAWEAADNTVAMISSEGNIFGRTPGVTQVYAIYKGVKVPCTVTVYDKDMYNLTVYMPDAGGKLHILGLKDDTEVLFAGDITANGKATTLVELKHDGVDKLGEVADNKYVVTGPLDAHTPSESEIMSYAAANGEVNSAMPYAELFVRFEDTQTTDIDDISDAEGRIFIVVNGNEVTICGADDGSLATVFDTAGMTVYRGLDRTITIGTPGLYMLNIADETFKFIIK